MKKQDTWGIIRRLFFIGMKFRSWFILTLIISIVLSIVSTYRPYLTMQVVDNDITKLKDEALMMKHIYILVGLVFAETILNFFLVFFSNYISQNVIRDIRERLYAKLIYFRTAFFDKTPIGQLVTRAVGDVETIATVYTDGFLDGFRGYSENCLCFSDDVQYGCSSELYYIGYSTINGGDYKILPEKTEKSFWG
jgi:ABC-type multidrug transport system, ATPase and permease components